MQQTAPNVVRLPAATPVAGSAAGGSAGAPAESGAVVEDGGSVPAPAAPASRYLSGQSQRKVRATPRAAAAVQASSPRSGDPEPAGCQRGAQPVGRAPRRQQRRDRREDAGHPVATTRPSRRRPPAAPTRGSRRPAPPPRAAAPPAAAPGRPGGRPEGQHHGRSGRDGRRGPAPSPSASADGGQQHHLHRLHRQHGERAPGQQAGAPERRRAEQAEHAVAAVEPGRDRLAGERRRQHRDGQHAGGHDVHRRPAPGGSGSTCARASTTSSSSGSTSNSSSCSPLRSSVRASKAACAGTRRQAGARAAARGQRPRCRRSPQRPSGQVEEDVLQAAPSHRQPLRHDPVVGAPARDRGHHPGVDAAVHGVPAGGRLADERPARGARAAARRGPARAGRGSAAPGRTSAVSSVG